MKLKVVVFFSHSIFRCTQTKSEWRSSCQNNSRNCCPDNSTNTNSRLRRCRKSFWSDRILDWAWTTILERCNWQILKTTSEKCSKGETNGGWINWFKEQMLLILLPGKHVAGDNNLRSATRRCVQPVTVHRHSMWFKIPINRTYFYHFHSRFWNFTHNSIFLPVFS